jgi:myo-inositol-1(or 4)-monophosphatase
MAKPAPIIGGKTIGGDREGPDLNAYLRFAHHLADEAARVTLPYFRTPLDIRNKASGDVFDPVTEADRAGEAALRALIMQTYPGHGIIGEEEAKREGKQSLTWILDPIDGTRAFMSGNPLWGTLIALARDEDILFGLVDLPCLQERFWAAEGQAFMRDGEEERRLAVRACASLAEAILCTTSPDLFNSDEESSAFSSVSANTRLTRYGGDCYLYCLLAAGLIDIVIEAGLQPYDVQALIPIVEAAGGIITNWSGASAKAGGQIIAAGDQRVHEQALNILRKTLST